MRPHARRRAARARWLVGLGLSLAAASPGGGQPSITLAAGVTNPPPPLTSIVPETAVAEKARLVKASDVAGVLKSTLDAQGYTAANNWVFSFTSPPLPAGLTNPVPFPANAQFNITAYNLYLNAARTQFGELFDFTLVNPPADPAPAGATVTRHWLQLLNEDRQYNGFGFALPGQSGFWQMDNGDVSGAAGGAGRGTVNGLGPYYDSNAPGGGASTPYKFHDSPEFYSGIGTYLHFTTFLAWDVAVGGKNYVVVGDTGIAWGFAIVPEPSARLLLTIGLALLAAAARARRARAG